MASKSGGGGGGRGIVITQTGGMFRATVNGQKVYATSRTRAGLLDILRRTVPDNRKSKVTIG